MPPATKPIPDGFHSLTPYIVVDGAAEAIEFYGKAFGAKECYRQNCEHTGKVINAWLQIGDSILMLNDTFPEWGCHGPSAEHPSAVTIHLYVDNVDEVFKRAIDAGATEAMPLHEAFWGDRYGKLTDPFGHSWSLATKTEDLTSEQIAERAKEAFAAMADQG